jgi:type IV pilus assembly protein PilC
VIAPGPPYQETNPDDQPLSTDLEWIDPLAEVVRSGLPLSAGLLAYSEEVPSHRMRMSLRRMARAIDAGRPLEDVLGNEASQTSDYLRGLVRAGIATDRLGEVLGEHLSCIRRTRLIRNRIWTSLAYPLVLLAVALVIGLFVLIWPIPAFREIFNDFGVQLPDLTLAFLNLSGLAVRGLVYWPWFLGAILICGALFYGIRYLPGRATRVRIWQYVPILGSASRNAAMSEFCSLLAILVESRVPLPDALWMTADAVRDPNVADGCRRLAEQVAHGLSAESEARALGHFPRSVVMLFRWQRQPVAFARALRANAELFATQARIQSGLLGLFMQPLLLFVIVTFVGTMVVALFLPLVKLLNDLS